MDDAAIPAHELRRLRAVAADDVELERLIGRRRSGEPLQYLEGTAAFGPIEVTVDERVLIPRPETEQLWELAVRSVSSPEMVVDLCTGSGALAIALAHTFGAARVIGTDLSSDALDVARSNGAGVLNLEFLQGDLYDALPDELEGSVDLLVANPPYVAESEYPDLPTDVRREPRMALVAGPTGFEVYHRLATGLDRWLAPGGVFAFEIGETQALGVQQILGDRPTEVHRDLAGRDRFVVGRRG